MLTRLATIALLSIAFATPSFAADGKTHRVAIQIDQNDPQVMNLALNNATNVIEYYRGKNEEWRSISSPTVAACTRCAPTPRRCRIA
jgi:hypothetical protein